MASKRRNRSGREATRKRARASAGRCYYCGAHLIKATATRDHLVPRSAGGANTRANTVTACKPCNTAKGSMSLAEFRARHNGGTPFFGESRKGG